MNSSWQALILCSTLLVIRGKQTEQQRLEHISAIITAIRATK